MDKKKKNMVGNVLRSILKSGIVTWFLLIVIWTIASKLNSPEFLPSPYVTLQGFLEILKKGVLWNDIKISMQRVAVGWIRGLVIAIPLGLLIGRFQIVRWLVEPFINFFRFVPAIGFLTLFLMWFGVGEESKQVLIMYATIFPVIINTIAGVAGIDPVKYQAAESLGAGPIQSFLTVTIPGAIVQFTIGRDSENSISAYCCFSYGKSNVSGSMGYGMEVRHFVQRQVEIKEM